ncbi:MAG: asparaginase [Helicobacteraceae bacterium 4484_230]|nr:MAG: asparaginase [Helicobacteraceae bacterium 4484_230]
MKIMNTGGTFNKRYSERKGKLEVPFDNEAVEKIVKSFAYDVDIAGVLYKDSLDMDDQDRNILAQVLLADEEDVFVVVHGTDTMDLSAKVLDETLKDRTVVLVGAMVPFSIDPVEASVNLGMAMGFAASQPPRGIYICMNGMIAPYERIRKNRALGKFEIV